MNIFITNNDPIKAANDLDDLRLNKMIVETAQIICTAARVWYSDDEDLLAVLPYKSTHLNHPVVRSVIDGDPYWFAWLLMYFNALSTVRAERFPSKPEHLTIVKMDEVMVRLANPLCAAYLNDKRYSKYTVEYNAYDCSGIVGLANSTIVSNYRQCLKEKWLKDKRPPKWTNSEPPKWFKEEGNSK